MAGNEKDSAAGSAVKRFAGDDEDPGKQLKKWKTWARAKMMTLKDLTKQQRAPWLLTLLDGKAWDACEHLTLEQLATEAGEDLLWDTLADRFPEKEQHDMMGIILGEIFSLSALDQETMKQWTARVREAFEKCKRRASVDFPSEARGWVALNCIGLSEEQKAIVKAKAQGSLKFDDISAALRSCFPAFKAVGKKRSTSVFQAEVDTSEVLESMDGGFGDVEAFLADHNASLADMPEDKDEVFSEGEAAEALAVSWKERRKEIAKFQQSRQFGSAGKTRRSFRVEIEELKKKTRCRKCNQLGHWARECKNPTAGNRDSDSKATGSQNAGVSYVEADNNASLSDEPEAADVPSFVGVATEVMAATLVQSPGFGVVDSGCGRTLIGRDTLQLLKPMMQKAGYSNVVEYEAENSFRFGNGAVEKSMIAVKLPVGVAGKFGLIDAAVISGCAPLLIGRPTLEKLRAKIDFDQGMLHFLDTKTKMTTNSAGQVLISILDYPKRQVSAAISQDCGNEKNESQMDVKSDREFKDDSSSTSKVKTKITLKKKECRCLLAQWNKGDTKKTSKVLVAELFSPPRFAMQAEKMGYKGLSYDIQQGYDLDDPKTQAKVSRELDEANPELLVVCPPCRNRGGWEHLNRLYRSPLETARLIRRARRQSAFCVEQIQRQLKRGKLRSGQNVSAFCAAYTPKFVRNMLETMVPDLADRPTQPCLAVDAELECLVSEVQAEPAAEQPVANQHDPKVMQAIRRLHCNLGHPSVKDLVRILRHSNATSEAIKAAQSFECDVCRNHVQPASALPAKTSRTTEFNEKIGLDVKYLPGWRENQQVPCISIIDYATSLHVMAPIFHRETAELTKGVLRDSWISWAGVPQTLELDPSSSNLSDMFGEYCESMGRKDMDTGLPRSSNAYVMSVVRLQQKSLSTVACKHK
eukprot:s2735_g9.t1